MPSQEVYLPIHVGREGKPDIGYVGDDTGDNISYKNANYCELTALYWAWKNLDADYIGLVHYRRYFTNKEVCNLERKKEQIITSDQWEQLVEQYQVIVADKRRYYIESNRSHYNHAHPREGLDLTEKIIKEHYPEYLNSFHVVMNRNWAHMFNMFVMCSDLYKEYCNWLFNILSELELQLDITKYSTYQSRVYGFIAERLLDVWLEHNGVLYKEQNVSFIEKQNWVKKGFVFLKRKFWRNGFRS